MQKIPIIDIFAGPGGLGEGFSQAGFNIVLSIEKDPVACQTLRLRALCRRIAGVGGDDALTVAYTKDDPFLDLARTFRSAAKEAELEAWNAILGKTPFWEIEKRIEATLGDAEDWVLIGGPPCQAYSLVGRSRMRTTRENFDDDHRHFLYREYLRIVATHAPPVFVMENVKGLISAKNKGEHMINRILTDLQRPRRSIKVNSLRHNHLDLEYDLVPVLSRIYKRGTGPNNAEDFLIRSEEHGIPQARHRLFLLGLRKDRNLAGRWKGIDHRLPVSVREAISDLPQIRSELSRRSEGTWSTHIREVLTCPWFHDLKYTDSAVASAITRAVPAMTGASGTGANLLPRDRRKKPRALEKWYSFDRLPFILHHESRTHMATDLQRYLFASAFSQVHGKSPQLRHFPRQLLPNHRNVVETDGDQSFDDRFRVQCWDQPSSTIMSHISKDGHYYIHPDPTQCRSLTVREVARLQTFPDDYYFCGPRTQQYHQVGNAVPPYLAFLIAKAVKSSFF